MVVCEISFKEVGVKMGFLQTMGEFFIFLIFIVIFLMGGLLFIVFVTFFSDKEDFDKIIDQTMKDCNEIRESSKTPILSDE